MARSARGRLLLKPVVCAVSDLVARKPGRKRIPEAHFQFLSPDPQRTPGQPPLQKRLPTLHEILTGRISQRVLLGVLLPVSYLCFYLGAIISLACLPQGFDYGFCVLSRLASSHHNPAGYYFLTFGLVAMPTLLIPVSCWLARCCDGCPKLSRWGRWTLYNGLLFTALVGIERAFFPTHWTSYEKAHLVMAGLAFSCLWLGLAMLAGALCSAEVPRVRWRWLFRPPWYLAACVLPIVVVFGMYLPLNIMPSVRSSVLNNWPRSLVFLRTITFWQWYLTIGLFTSYSFAAREVCRRQRLATTTSSPLAESPWRLDNAQESAIPAPHHVEQEATFAVKAQPSLDQGMSPSLSCPAN